MYVTSVKPYSTAMQNRAPVVHIYPKGTYKAPPFYFRGSEPLSEPEYLVKQLSIARADYRKAKRELEKEKAEYEQISQELSKKDTYTVALASALGEESSATEENAKLRQDLAEISTKIEAVERSIDYFKQQQNTAFISGLHKERAYYQTEIENLRFDVLRGIDDIRDGKANLGDIVCSNKFADALQRGAELSAVRQLHSHLRGKSSRLFKSFSNTKPPKNVARSQISTQVHNVKELLEQKHQLVMELDELQHEKFYTEVIARTSSLAMVDQIESMNRVLIALGGDEVNCEELRAHFKAPERQSPQKERDVDAEEENEKRPKTRTERRTKGGLPTKRARTSQARSP